MRTYMLTLLLSSFVLGLFSGCTSTGGVTDDVAPSEEVVKKEYLTGVVVTEKDGTKEIDCSQKLLGCREGEVDGEAVLICMGGEPMGSITIAGGVTDYTLEKELC